MQSKTNTVQSMKSEQSRRSSSNNVGRRQLAISRRVNTFPYYRSKVNNENHCYKCDQGDDYINSLSTRIARIESLVDDLNKTVKAATPTQKIGSSPLSALDSVNLSKMSIDELLRFSSQLGIRLFGNLDKEKKSSIKIEQKEQKEQKESKDKI
ncbi:17250_t:CDS:1 [Funneliformis geosporum]|uniref:7552_t:CDS:1 n=1 Tax=Funneliformis geosporum TaxID=1117311 RepID=A0A9W4S9C1_9GLOM|nr:7552_t:CDS:1 [Funneliformis geosporum]CAI2161635.1 17250_t:CDS:1 [Funneliformis geosporum]